MKKALICIGGGMAFWLFFAWRIGAIHVIVSATHYDSSKDTSIIQDRSTTIEERMKITDTLYRYYDHLVKTRQATVTHGGIYSATEYFNDLVAVRNFRKRHSIAEVPNFMQLQRILEEERGDGKIGEDDIIKARDKMFPNDHHDDKPIDWPAVWVWIMHLYLTMLPAAALYFLMWMYKQAEEDEARFRFTNPVSFILAVLIHPFVIAYFILLRWIETSREFIARVEIQRTKRKLFSMLSEDELALVRQFAKNRLSFRGLGQHLRLNGRVIHHSCAAACIATLILYCTPTGAARYYQHHDKRETIRTVVTPLHQYGDQVCHSVRKHFIEHDECEPWIQQGITEVLYEMKLCVRRLEKALSLPRGFPRITEPIPLRPTTFV